MTTETIIGIDLGTTNSEVACIINGQPAILKDADDATGILPSIVGLDSSGKVLVGHTARNQAVAAPERTVLSVKRSMGSDARLHLGDASYSPQEISAFILRTLKERAQRHLGKPVGKAVVTVPAYFTDAQRQATREAGAIAGLDIVRIINEPTAAALTYGVSGGDGTILVYDLGGGTFDVSVVRAEAGVVEVLATAGDNHLGGDDFDQVIAAKLVEHLEQNQNLAVREDRRAMTRLLRSAEAAKVQLSSQPHATVEEDHLGEVDGTQIHLRYELSRQTFEELIEPLIDRTIEAVSRALADANLRPSDLTKIILVGGSSRIPLVRKRLRERLAKQPHEEVDPELCVALGAALQAGTEMGLSVDGVLVDVTPYTFGTSCLGTLYGAPYDEQFVPMIHRNSKLPIERSEVFYRVFEDQKTVEVEIYQGEDPDARKNIKVGKFTFEGLKAIKGNTDPGVVLKYRLNNDGILEVTATDRISNKQVSRTIENAMAQHDAQTVLASQARVAELCQDGDDAAKSVDSEAEAPKAVESSPIVLPADLRATLDRAEILMHTATEDDKVELIDLMEAIRETHRVGATEPMLTARQKLEDILFYLE